MYSKLLHLSLKVLNEVKHILQQLAIQVIEILLEFSEVFKLALS